jgi:hypothetical protein
MERDLTESFKNVGKVKKIEIDEGFNNINIYVYYFDYVVTICSEDSDDYSDDYGRYNKIDAKPIIGRILDEDKIYVRYYEEDRQDLLNSILDIEEDFLNKYPGFKFDFINIPIPLTRVD